MRAKVTVVGAGNVGATCAQELARRDYADVVLVDIKEGLPQGKALDINQAAAVLGYEANVTGSAGSQFFKDGGGQLELDGAANFLPDLRVRDGTLLVIVPGRE